MTYKDKDKQREAGKERQRRYRDKHKGVTSEGVTNKALLADALLLNDDDEVDRCIDKMATKPERTVQGNIRVSKPGDPDYVPQCETTRAFIEDRDKRPGNAKRGTAIKTFEDLPADVQASIRASSDTNEEFKKRTQAAIKYQHLFPDRYESPGLSRTTRPEGASL